MLKALSWIGVWFVVGLGCAAGGGVGGDPVAVLRDPDASATAKRRAVERAQEGIEDGTIRREEGRAALKTLAWSTAMRTDLRIAALGAVFADEGAAEDSREMARLMVAREPDMRVVERLCEEIVRRSWADASAALVRSLSRPDARLQDRERPEYRAIEALHPGRGVGRVAFDVFVHPPANEGPLDLRIGERTRSDAWSLLGRLDADGALRLSLISEPGIAGEDPTLLAIRACVADLRTIPLTGDEIAWLDSMRAESAWWARARDAVARLDAGRSKGLRLWHIPALVWIAEHRAELLEGDGASAREEIGSRLARETIHRRLPAGGGGALPRAETIEGAAFAWGDFATAVVLRELLDDGDIVGPLFDQAALDQADATTEYGGIMVDRGGGEVRAALFPPRPAQRRGDREFIASDEMVAASTFALAHYHFHVQREENREFAGPSPADLAYAERMGRSCLVLTSLRRGVMGADLYMPGGRVIDLGEVVRR